MNELQVPMQFDRRHFLEPDSVLVRTALDLVSTHVADTEGESASCRLCGLRFPCPTVHHARQVVDAGGVTQAGDTVAPDAVGAEPVGPETVGAETVGPEIVVPDTALDAVPDTDSAAAPGTVADAVPGALPQGAPDVEAERRSDPAAKIEDELLVPDPVGAA